MEDDSNSRFGLADDDELAGFDMDGAIATSAKKNAAASSPSLFQHAVAPSHPPKIVTRMDYHHPLLRPLLPP